MTDRHININTEFTCKNDFIIQNDSVAPVVKKKKKKKQKDSIAIAPGKDTINHRKDSLKNISDTSKESTFLNDSLKHRDSLRKVYFWKFYSDHRHELRFYHDDSNINFNTKNNLIYSLDFTAKDSALIHSKSKITTAHKETKTVNPPPSFYEKSYFRFATDWMILIFVVLFFILGWINAFYRKYFLQILQAVYDNKSATKLFEEKNSVSSRVAFSLNFVFIASFSLLFYQMMHYFNLKINYLDGFLLYGAFFIALSVIYITKYIFYNFIAVLLNVHKEIDEFLHNTFLYNKVFGILTLPLTVLIPFAGNSSKILVIAGFVLFAITLLFRIFRGLVISNKINFSIFYLILYLCAIEILPILIIGKFFIKLIHS